MSQARMIKSLVGFNSPDIGSTPSPSASRVKAPITGSPMSKTRVSTGLSLPFISTDARVNPAVICLLSARVTSFSRSMRSPSSLAN